MNFIGFLIAINFIYSICESKQTFVEVDSEKNKYAKELNTAHRNPKVDNYGEYASAASNPFYSIPSFYSYPYAYPVPSTYYPPSNTAINNGFILPSLSQPPTKNSKFSSFSQSPLLITSKISAFAIQRNATNNQSNNTSSYSASSSSDFTNQNPCENVHCKPGYTCVLKKRLPCFGYGCPFLPVCVNPCNYAYCSDDSVCQVEQGECPPPYCDPVAVCTNLCDGIDCADQNCSTVYLPCNNPPCAPVPICGKDPCIGHRCPAYTGCYLQTNCDGPFCTVKPVCKNPCEFVNCDNPDEYCYPEEVACFRAPCNPIPVCKNPCDFTQCPERYICVVDPRGFCVNVLGEPQCRPVAECRPTMRKTNSTS